MVSFPVVDDAVFTAARGGLCGRVKTLPPWLFYDEAGSRLFERITELPEYYLTRTERALLREDADEILDLTGGEVTVAELGAGTATKTGLLLAAAASRQGVVVYQPIDVSASALRLAREHLEGRLRGVVVREQVANYITEPIRIVREPGTKVLALYIGSSVGNFSPDEARSILCSLRSQLRQGDALLLGTDLAPSLPPAAGKTVAALLAAYDDAEGVTAAFNKNVLVRLNRELGTDFDGARFAHEARWNADASRIEMHLRSLCAQRVRLPESGAGPAVLLPFAAGETIHTENSYKFTTASITALLSGSGFKIVRSFCDCDEQYALTLAGAV